MVSKILSAVGLGPKEKDSEMPEDNKEDVVDVTKKPGDGVEETDDLPEGDELDAIILGDLIARGKIKPDSIVKKEAVDTDSGGFRKPAGWEYLDEDEKIAYVVEHGNLSTKKAIEDAVKLTEERILSRMAPISRDNVVKEIESICDPEYASFAKKALEETEKMFGGKKATQISAAEKALVAERAELMYLRSKGGGPSVVDGDDVPKSGADQKVIAYMRRYNAARPGQPLNYEAAKARYARSAEEID